jgi:hypothetical protein
MDMPILTRAMLDPTHLLTKQAHIDTVALERLVVPDDNLAIDAFSRSVVSSSEHNFRISH